MRTSTDLLSGLLALPATYRIERAESTYQQGPFALPIRSFRLWRLRLAGLFVGIVACSGSTINAQPVVTLGVTAADNLQSPANTREARMWITIGERRFALTLADTEAAHAFAARLPLSLDMTDLNGNEKKFDLPQDLPANASRPGTIRTGDLLLYGSNTVVLFYLTFDSPYSYTRLGQIKDPNGLAQALGQSRVKVEFSTQ